MEPLYNDDGELVGYLAEADDGALVVFDTEAETIIAAQDPHTGDWLDPAGYEIETEQPDGYTALDERLDRIEAAVNEPRPMQEVMVTRGMEQADVGRLEEDMRVQADHLEAALGRPLLVEERRRIAHQVYTDVEAGDARPDLYDAAHKSGGLLDLDGGTRGQNHEARVEFMAQRMRDNERVTNAAVGLDDLTYSEPPATADFYDLDNRAERQAFMSDRLRGATDAGSAYSSSDPETWE